MTTHAIDTPEPGAREAFLRKHGVTLLWKHLGGDPRKEEHVRFRFTLKRRGVGEEPPVVWAEINYTAGWGHFIQGRGVLPLVPEVESFLECVRSDCRPLRHHETFESFVDELGLNDDAKNAVAIWEGCKAEWDALVRILGRDAAAEFVDLDIEDKWR